MLRKVGKRFFLHDANLTAKNGKPAITGSTHVFVSKKFPVVMLQDMPGVGRKGEIVFVPRGFARHKLLPEGLAVSGSLWQNIDTFADPELIHAAKVDKVGAGQTEAARPFDWVNNVHLSFIEETTKSDASLLKAPITKWDVLRKLSNQEELDLLPADLTLPHDALKNTGDFTVTARLAFRGWSATYNFRVKVLSREEEDDKERRRVREEQAKLKAKKSYVLGQSLAS